MAGNSYQLNKIFSENTFLRKIVISLLKSFFFVIRKSYKLLANKSGSVVVISLHKLGDTVFTIPAVRAIQKSYNDIIIYCYPEVIPIYKIGLENVKYCTVNQNDFYFDRRIANSKARKLFKALKPAIVFDLTGVMTSASLLLTSRAEEIIGKNREVFKTIYDYYSPFEFNSHLMDFYLDAVSSKNPSIGLEVSKEVPLSLDGCNRILIHPFAGWDAKEWNLNKFLKLASSLNNEYQLSLISALDNISAEIKREIEKNELTLIETKNVSELINCIKKSAVLIGNDSGPIQIASLLGKATFSIYGPTNPKFHIPFGEHHEFCRSELECLPREEKLCFTEGGRYGCPSFECMNQLSIEEVFKDVRNFLSRIFGK